MAERAAGQPGRKRVVCRDGVGGQNERRAMRLTSSFHMQAHCYVWTDWNTVTATQGNTVSATDWNPVTATQWKPVSATDWNPVTAAAQQNWRTASTARRCWVPQYRGGVYERGGKGVGLVFVCIRWETLCLWWHL